MLDLQAELHDHGQPYQELYEAVGELKRRHDLHPCAVRPRDGLALRGDGERERVQDLVSRFRKLPEDTRRQLPALLNSLAQLEIVIGDLEASLEDFQEVTRLVSDPIARAEAHHNVYRAALERRDFVTALHDLRRAVALDGETFAPFPFDRYEPKQILGVGGFGVSYLCRETDAERDVVIRSLRTDALERDVDTLFREFRTVETLDNPALIRIHDTGRSGPDDSMPYIVMEHFPGQSLSEFLAQNGALDAEQWMEIAWPLARALQILHNHGVLHRSLRPGCVLVRKAKTSEGRSRLQIKVLDTGLSLKRAFIHASACYPDSHFHSSLGRSVARLLAFQPPEVTGRPKGQVWVGPHSDLYSFGRLCAAGLTGRPDPDRADRLLLPEAWQTMLDECTAWTISKRPSHAGIVLDRLAALPDSEKLISRIERDLYEETIAVLDRRLKENPGDHGARVNRANAYFRQGEFAKSLLDFGEAIAQTPDDASLYRRRAAVYIRLQDTDNTIKDYTESLRLEPRDLESLAQRGQAYAQKNEYEKAIADYTAALRINSRDEALWYNRGNAHSARGNYDRALADYNEVLRINPRHAWATGNRGKVHALRGDQGKALTDFNRLLQLDPGNLRGLIDRATTLLALGHADRAIVDYTEALRLDPSAALFHERGLAHLRQGDAESAITDLGEALALSPGNAALLLTRARAFADANRSDEALADLDEAIANAPQSAGALAQRAELYARLGRHTDAVNDLNEAVRLNASPAMLFARGLALAEQGEYDRAIADFSEVIRLDPQASAAFTNRGTARVRLGELEAALDDYTRALEQTPEDALTRLNRAGVHSRLGNHDAALADYTELIRLEPDSANARAQRGLLLASRGDLDAALIDFDRAIRRQPDNPRTRNHRGHILAEQGELPRARADFEEAVRLDPSYALAWFNLALTHADLGDLDEAIAAFTRVLEIDPGNAAALNGRGNVRRMMGETVEALADFTAALAADDAFSPARYNRAGLLARRGDHAEALLDLDEQLRRDADDINAYITRGRVHGAMGRYDLAIADNEEALRRSPGDARLLNNLAWLYATAPDATLRDANKAIERARAACAQGEDATRLDTLAAALAAGGQYEEAVQVQQRAMERANEGAQADFAERLALYREGKAYTVARS